MLTESDISLLSHQLAEFGFNQREARIYVQSLQAGPASIQELSRKLGFNRVTVHSAVEQLIQKGLLYETRRGKKRLIAAEPPSVFSQMLKQRESELKVLQGTVGELVERLSSISTPDARMPAVRFYEEVDGLKKMLEETLTTRGEVLVFSYVDKLADLLQPDYLEDYFRRRAEQGIHTRLIFPPGRFAKRVNKRAKEYRIEIRLLPPEYEWQSGIFAWDDSLAILSYTLGKVSCTIVSNQDIAHFYRNVIFELVWKQAEVI